MSVAAISSAPSLPPAASTAATASTAKAADGDYTAANANSVQTKDSDGDYRPRASSPAAQSAPSVQAALTSLKIGG